MKDSLKIYMAVVSMLWAISAGVLGWTVTTVVEHSAEIAALKVQATQETTPPQWFIDRVDTLERKIDSIQDKLSEHK